MACFEAFAGDLACTVAELAEPRHESARRDTTGPLAANAKVADLLASRLAVTHKAHVAL